MRRTTLAALLVLVTSPVLSAEANTFVPPQSLAVEALSESVTTAFAPTPLSIEDFALEWEGRAPAGVSAELVPGSLQWVRISGLLVLPRARLAVHASGSRGLVQSAGFAQPLSSGSAELPVALMAGPDNAVELSIGGKVHRLRIRFKPRDPALARPELDSSCSRFDLRVSAPGWSYVGCRLIEMKDSALSSVPSLELVVYWEGASALSSEGQTVASAAPGLWILRLRPDPGQVTLVGVDGRTMGIEYQVAERFHHVALSLGLGPYSYQFNGQRGTSVSTVTPEVTLYGSYFINETNRIVAFGVGAFHQTSYLDFGVYLNTEQARLLDNRLAVNLLLGAHVIGFRSLEERFFRFGAPQGIELVYSDAFVRAHNLSAGAFIYPPVGDAKQYYNAWFRWGSTRFFAELNYIAWQESIEGDRIYSRSLGAAVGFPLGRFF